MPKEAKRLFDKQVAALKQPGLYPVGGDVQGLALRVTAKRGKGASGVARSWVLRLSTGETRTSQTGKPFAVRRDFGLGSYPEISLSEARQKAAELRALYRSGVDPGAARKAAKVEQIKLQAKRRTFKDVAHECHGLRTEEFSNPKHAAQWIKTLESYAFPTIGALPVSEIEPSHLADLLRPIWVEKHETATRVRQRIGSVLDFAIAKELRPGPNPADIKGPLGEQLPKSKGVRKKSGGKKHHARVPVEAMPRFLADLRTRTSISAKALEFAVLTAARSGEVRGATWGEIDLEARVWRLSAERMKADRIHRVPLSDAAVALLESLPRGPDTALVFTNSKGGALSDATLGKMLKDLHAASVERGGVGYGDPDQPGRIATPHGTARSSFKDWSRKSTARVMANGNRSSFPDEWSELALAHINSDETRSAYARDELLEERRELMQTWADYCKGAKSDNVVAIGGQR
ncbi:tyrosine-type recombinase/integrase [Pseudomonas profundi]|uniref:tyrosine-type recombinase/integrase n=1 Tax=Pseudomonas profundi TaxID=1981513 RepID=UPI00123C18DB|nr:integrase arm-type DNA-binding domain-containing protein [Pseudomonas profundi]